MRVLVIFAHPLPESFHAALHQDVLTALREAGHVVDDLDLYAEGFDPVLGAQERRAYHDLALNRAPMAGYIERLLAAEALVLCFPVWTFGPPAILKGFFDRALVPGVAFHLVDGGVKPGLTNLKTIAAVTSYGQTRLKAWYVGDPPRKLVTRYLRWQSGGCQVRYLAQYGMNAATEPQLARFRAHVRGAMRGL
jgi:NAD(P)H dehydrogenase (quinone)